MRRLLLPVGQVAGVPIRVHAVFLLLISALLAVSVQRQGLAGLAHALPVVASALLALLSHELGHALVARRVGVAVPGITLGPLVNVAWLGSEPETRAQDVQIASGGPAANALLAGTFLLLGLAPGEASWARAGLWINTAMAAGNLLPVFPLDGGRILRALLAAHRPHLIATRLAVKVGNVLVVALLALTLAHPAVHSSWVHIGIVVLLAVALLRAGAREFQSALCRELRLQFQAGSEVAESLSEALTALSAPSPRSGRPLTPAQFRRWREPCEAAFRRRQGEAG